MTDWLTALTVVDVMGALIALGVVGGSLKWLLPILSGLHDFLSDWKGEPERPGVPARPGVPERLATLDETTQRNSGAITAILERLDDMAAHQGQQI